jgi:hypothetical protein
MYSNLNYTHVKNYAIKGVGTLSVIMALDRMITCQYLKLLPTAEIYIQTNAGSRARALGIGLHLREKRGTAIGGAN